MSKARYVADLLADSGDVKATKLDEFGALKDLSNVGRYLLLCKVNCWPCWQPQVQQVPQVPQAAAGAAGGRRR